MYRTLRARGPLTFFGYTNYYLLNKIMSILKTTRSPLYVSCMIVGIIYDIAYDHHQPINVPTAGAQAFLTDYT
jgi:Na+/glutamate symporter